MLNSVQVALLAATHVCVTGAFTCPQITTVFTPDSTHIAGTTAVESVVPQPSVVFSNIRIGMLGIEGQMTNRAHQAVSLRGVTYRVIYNDGARLTSVVAGTANVDRTTLNPGGSAQFGDRFSDQDRDQLRRYFLNALWVDISYEGRIYRLRMVNDPHLNSGRL